MQCRICKNSENNANYEVREMMFGTLETFSYFQCSNCECLQIADIPQDMSQYYPEGYYSYRPNPSGKTRWYSLLMKTRNRYALTNKGILGRLLFSRRPYRQLQSLSQLELPKSKRILDVGCGSGSLLYALRELGFEHVGGIDPFNQADIAYHNGLLISRKALVEVEGSWDVIMFHHSFEHMPNPSETLAHVSRLLVDTGDCLIRIPTVSSYAWHHYKTHWVQLDAPRHFFLHSMESMSRLAADCGFEVASVIFDSHELQFWGSEQYLRGVPLRDSQSYAVNPKASMFSRRQIRDFAAEAKRLNQERIGDQAAFRLRKTGSA